MLYFLSSVKDKMEGKIPLMENSYDSEEKKISNENMNSNSNNNSNSMFKINLFSAEKNLDSAESSYFESDNSISHNFDSEQSVLKTSHFDYLSSENSYSEYLESNGNNNNTSTVKKKQKNNNLQEVLQETLDDLRNTFSKITENKKI